MNPSSEQDHVAVYREKITDEICKAFGFSPTGVMRRWLGPLFRLPTNRFGRIAVRVDDEVGSSGLSGGARRILPDLSLEVTARGAENIPTDGPLLIVSNHPGAFDSVAILSCIPRKDVKVLLSDVPFTRAFASARRYFIYVPPDASGRMTTLRASIDHLKSGGALLIFAHGDVEPDPEVSPGAGECIQDWSRSIEMMLGKVPDCRLQVTIVSGVLLPKFVFSPIVKIRKTAAKRQKLAEFLQISRQMAFARGDKIQVHISFAKPVRGMDLPREETMSAVIDIARRLLKDHLESLGPHSNRKEVFMDRRKFMGHAGCGLAAFITGTGLADAQEQNKPAVPPPPRKRYKIDIEIYEARPDTWCHKKGDKFSYPADLGKICPYLQASLHDFLVLLQQGVTLPWKYEGTPYEKVIDPDGVTTEYVRCPDPTSNLVAKITRTLV